MIRAYINYPNPHITVHADEACATIQQQHKEGQRIVKLDIQSLSTILSRFGEKGYRFGSEAAFNDMWIEVDLSDAAFEQAIVEYVRTLLARHYRPFMEVVINTHC